MQNIKCKRYNGQILKNQLQQESGKEKVIICDSLSSKLNSYSGR